MIAPATISEQFREDIRAIAETWWMDPERPQVEATTIHHWQMLIKEWLADAAMPILVRKAGLRGSVIHHPEGRDIVPVDNAPANWAYSAALVNRRPDIDEIRDHLVSGQFPIAMILKAAERRVATYTGVQGSTMDPPNLNTLGYKVCHIRGVGLRTRRSVEEIPLQRLSAHFVDLMSPSNMFLVPKSHAGLGELPEFIEVFASTSR